MAYKIGIKKLCGIVGAVAQRDVLKSFSKVYVVWNTAVMTPPVWPSSITKVI